MLVCLISTCKQPCWRLPALGAVVANPHAHKCCPSALLTIRSDSPWVSGHRFIIPQCLLNLFCCYIFTPCGYVCAVSPDLGQTLIPVPVSCWLSCAPPLLLSLFGPEGREPELTPRWAVSHFFLAVSPSLTHQPRWYSLGNAAMAMSHRAGLSNGKIVYSV